MSSLKLSLASSLEKIFPEGENATQELKLSSLIGETISFQVACYYDGTDNKFFQVKVTSPIEDRIIVREVVLAPSAFPCYRETDEGYLRTAPGLFPDILRNLAESRTKLVAGQTRSIWIDVEVQNDCVPGTYPIHIELVSEDGAEANSITTEVKIIGVTLPELPIKHTEWFHGDCLADYYQTEACSEEHFEIMENFIETAAKRDINMILIPQFTPPLDTAVGGERTTIQLVDVYFEHGIYQFKFDKMKRFIDICLKHGIKYLEMSHLFTQWGAKAAPKIMATVDGTYQQIFGWDTPATGGKYEEFLKCYLVQLTSKLKEWGVKDITYFHLSDEPHMEHMESYQKARELVKPYLKDFQMIDALSDLRFYENELIEQPICSIDKIEAFLDHKVPQLWSYYCTSEYLKVSNRFMSMASYRNRMYGLQSYLSGVIGILHWGYNFYNTQYSFMKINPYVVTDCGCSFPSGDPFLVYPGKDRKPEESIRIMVLYEAMTDIRALRLLESMSSREYVLSLIYEELDTAITYKEYPKNSEYYLELREKINSEIERLIYSSICN